ncbi:hypothetical protein ACN27F_20025 [Solwaraspora sp. WMMB335]|uniref:hypothetical protein n=1 Tax=Solwaraspora sp. WMMB335 TaxID=3404118 RepID=UPI003B92500A
MSTEESSSTSVTPVTDSLLTPKEELEVACAMAASFQANIQHADGKGGMLAVLVSGVVTLMITQAEQLRSGVSGSSPTAVALIVALSVSAVALAVTGLQLAAVLRPRLTPPNPVNRFAFPSLANRVRRPTIGSTTADLCVEAWALNELLAAIALAKHRRIMSAVAGTVALVIACLASLVLSVAANG